MSTTKISQLPAASSPVSPSDVAPVVQNGVTKKAAINQLGYLPAGNNAVTRTIQSKLRDIVDVVDFGADPTGSADSTSAIQNAINAAASANQRICAYGTFKISSKIVIKGETDFSQAIFNVYGTPAVAVEISTGSAANPTDNLFNYNIWMPLEINNMTKPGTGWAGQGIGVRTINLNSCRVFFNQIKNFDTGLLITAYSEGNAYNDYHIGALINNKVNLKLSPGDATGYVNENNFYGGRYFFYSAEGTNVSGTRHISIPTATSVQNNNIFYKPSIEGDTPEYHIENAGQYNTFVQARFEAAPPKVLYVGDTSAKGTYNVISGGYGAGSIAFSYSGSSSSFDNQVHYAPDRNIVVGSSNEGIYRYTNRASSSNPIYSFFPATLQPSAATSTEWSVRHSANLLQGKRSADSYERIKLDYQNGYIYLGIGSSAITSYFANNTNTQLGVYAVDGFVPLSDNLIYLGRSNLRWSEVYAANGTINTSDGNEKQDVVELNEAEKRVAIAIKSKIKRFRFKDAVSKKGDNARLHVGVVAQDVKAAFEAEGLDASRYGMFCSDKLEDGSERLGIRYDQLFAFIIGAI